MGQDAAKKAVAVAIRNRWRRQQLPPELRKDVTPKNIIMIGPTGVGKTEIARRLAQLVGAPFLKIEATKYTEVGYHGRDVESMIRDLTEIAIGMVRQEQRRGRDPGPASASTTGCSTCSCPRPCLGPGEHRGERAPPAHAATRCAPLEAGELEERLVELKVEQKTVPCRSSPTSAWSRWMSISRTCSSAHAQAGPAAAGGARAKLARSCSSRRPKP